MSASLLRGKPKMRRPPDDKLADVEDDLRVALETRQELGVGLEDEVIESFLSRVEEKIDARVEARVKEELHRVRTLPRFASPSNGRVRVVLGYFAGFLALSIPLAAVAGAEVALLAVGGGAVVAAFTLILPEGKKRAELGSGEGDNRTDPEP